MNLKQKRKLFFSLLDELGMVHERRVLKNRDGVVNLQYECVEIAFWYKGTHLWHEGVVCNANIEMGYNWAIKRCYDMCNKYLLELKSKTI